MSSYPICNGNRCNKVVLKTTRNKNVKFKIINIRTGCQSIGDFYYSENLNWAAQNLRLGHMRPVGRGLDIAALVIREGLQGGTPVGLPSAFLHKKTVFTVFAFTFAYRVVWINSCIFVCLPYWIWKMAIIIFHRYFVFITPLFCYNFSPIELYSCISFESRQFFKGIFYLKQINVITVAPLERRTGGNCPPLNPALNACWTHFIFT